LTAFGLGFPPHVQRKARTDLPLRAHAIDVALPLALAPGAAFPRIGRGGPQRLIATRQGCCHRGGQALLQRVPEGWEPLDAPPPLGQCVESGLGPTAPIAQRGPLFQDRPQSASRGPPTADAPQGLAFRGMQGTVDDQRPRGAPRGAWRFPSLVRAGRLLGHWRARAPCGPFGLLRRAPRPGAGPSPQPRFAPLGAPMHRPAWMRPPADALRPGLRRARGASRRDTPTRQGACRPGRGQTPQTRSEVVVGGIVVEDVSEEARGAAMIARREPTDRSVRALLSGHSARTVRQRPGQAGGGPARLRLVFPPPRPRFGSWHKGPRRGGLATGAHAPGDTASRPRPRAVPPGPSHGGGTDGWGAPERRGPRERPCGTASRSAAPP